MPLQIYKIASTTVTASAGQANIEFTNIPQGYTDLLVNVSFRAVNDTADYYIRFNGLNANLTSRVVYGTGALTNSLSLTGILFTSSRSTNTTSVFGNGSIYIPNYSGSTNKSVSIDSVSENNATAAFQQLTAGLWSDTAAITSIQMLASTGNLAQYSTATLYGVL